MTFWFPPGGEEETGVYDFDSEITLDYCSFSSVTSYLTVDHDIDVCVDIDGNEATFLIDVQAFGDNTAVELNLVVITNDNWSSLTATGYSAVD